MIWVLIAILTIPLLTAAMVLFGGSIRRMGVMVAPFAALPALIPALLRDSVDPGLVDWLLLGSWLGLDETGLLFLLVTALLWLMAGIYARAYHADDPLRHRFFFYFSLTMAGNLGLILAQDIVTFYATFALMTFAAYGLIVHTRTGDAVRAGKVYIVMAVIGEGFLIAGLVLTAYVTGEIRIDVVQQGIADSEWADLIILCVLAGFGIKAGAIPLHIWLPLAHPVAPTAASAVLSGAMIKAGLLGWIRVLPLGEGEFSGWGTTLLILSLTAAFFGILVGVTQEDPKTLLAYSSISQMGFITTAIAVGLAAPNAWETALLGCSVYVLHHGLTKGVLFLGVGVAHETGNSRTRQRLVLIGLTIASLSLGGAPLATGALAKVALKEGTHLGPESWVTPLDWLLPLAAAGTTVLVGRFLWIIWRNELGHVEHGQFRGMAVPWGLLLVLTFPVVWLAPAYYGLDLDTTYPFEPSNLWTATWPVLLAGLILLGMWLTFVRGRVEVRPVQVPAGDVLIPLQWVLMKARPPEAAEVVPNPRDPVASLGASWYGLFAESSPDSRTARFSHWLERWDVAGLILLSIGMLLVLLLLRG